MNIKGTVERQWLRMCPAIFVADSYIFSVSLLRYFHLIEQLNYNWIQKLFALSNIYILK